MSLDLTDLAGDPDLTSHNQIVCFRRTRTTSQQGKSVITQQQFFIYATVAPASGRQLQRLPEGDRTTSGLSLYTTTEMMVNSAGYAPDIVMWKNQPYLVQMVDDYSTNGFYTVVATLKQVVGEVPFTAPS